MPINLVSDLPTTRALKLEALERIMVACRNQEWDDRTPAIREKLLALLQPLALGKQTETDYLQTLINALDTQRRTRKEFHFG